MNKLGTQFLVASISSNFVQVIADSMSVEATLTYEVSVNFRHGHRE